MKSQAFACAGGRGRGRALRFPLAFALVLLCLGGCEQPGGRGGALLDSDAALKSLSVSAGNLEPAFSPEITGYAVTVNNAVQAIVVSGVPNSPAASLGGGGAPQALTAGSPAVVTFTVKAEDGTRRAYTVTVTRLGPSPIPIGSAEDLAKIGADNAYPLAANYELTTDLTLSDWTPIGRNSGSAFTGAFNGKGRKITVKSFDASALSGPYLGIFGYLKGDSLSPLALSIKDLTVAAELDCTAPGGGDYYVGALAGYAAYAGLREITVEGSLAFKSTGGNAAVFAGGLAGALYGGSVKDCMLNAELEAQGAAANGAYSFAGGAVGMFDGGASISGCNNTGDVTGKTSGPGTNVFSGGIAGGSFYSMSTTARGTIANCSSTGNVSAEGGGFWSWAGGIAGVIAGSGTSIKQCFATGSVIAEGPSGSWPYAGGIAGYNYFGARISQCYFDGAVEARGEGVYFDYTGGIAGYNSKEYGHGSVIEDCYSAGTVKGRVNSGGIVGQNQVCATVRRCYSTAAITLSAEAGSGGSQSRQGGGGIAGYNAPDDGKGTGTVHGCAALNPSIESGGFTGVHRVAGISGGTAVLANNYAWEGMAVSIAGTPQEAVPNPGGEDGEGCAEKPNQAWYEDELGWDFVSTWEMGGGGYPVLRWQQ